MPWQEDRGISGSRRTRSAARDGAGDTLASIAGVTITREGRYSLPKDRLGTPRNATEALATPSRQPASLHGLRVSSPLEADSDRLQGTALEPARQGVSRGTVTIAKNNLPIADLVKHQPRGTRRLGLLRGRIVVPDDFSDEDPAINEPFYPTGQ